MVFKVWLTELGASLAIARGMAEEMEITVLGNTKRSSHELSACQTANIFNNCLQCEGDGCFGAAQPTAPLLLRCTMPQSPEADFLTHLGQKPEQLQNGQVTLKNHSTVMLGKPAFQVGKRH